MEVDGATTCSVLVAELATGVLRSFRRRFVKAILSMAPFRARSFIFFRTRNAGVMSTTLPNCRKIYRVPLATGRIHLRQISRPELYFLRQTTRALTPPPLQGAWATRGCARSAVVCDHRSAHTNYHRASGMRHVAVVRAVPRHCRGRQLLQSLVALATRGDRMVGRASSVLRPARCCG